MKTLLRRAMATGLMLVCPLFASAQDKEKYIQSATYIAPTTRYDHGILGDAIEYGAMRMLYASCEDCANPVRGSVRITLPQNRVFEDLKPRLIDLDNDRQNEVVVIETDLDLGARLAVYDLKGLIDATPFIGRTHRWLAPIGAADLDGDGFVELAYILKPHLAKELLVWRWRDRKLAFVAKIGGLTNHRIGQDFISGGIRDCGQGPELVSANSNWSLVMVTTFDGGSLVSRPVGPFRGTDSINAALTCP